MILTEDKTYTMSLETEDNSSDSVLTNKTVELEFSNKELLHAIITCGMPIQRLTAAYPEKRRLEVLYKLFLVETALDTEGDRLKKARKIAYLDSSEKSVISYYMGMFFTKMISSRLYGTDYLTQLNLIRKPDEKEFIDFFASEWRPEMIGYRPGAQTWSVWEAKGGSNRREQALKKGAQQLEAIGTVNGALATPVGQVRHRSRVSGVVQHAESFAALFVVGAVQVYTVTEHMGFAVRNTFINGEKRVIYLFFHQKKFLSFHFRRNNIVPPGLSSLYAIFLHLSIAFFLKKQKKRFINLVVLTKLFRRCFYVENREFCRKDTCQASFQHTLRKHCIKPA